jgi:hypothetical protein
VAPLEINAGTCGGKNKIGPRGRSVEKTPGSDFTFKIIILYSTLQYKIRHVSAFIGHHQVIGRT